AIIARLISDYANIKKVSSVSNKEEHIEHVAKICNEMENGAKALIVSSDEGLAKKLAERLSIPSHFVNTKI
ncbi:MAG: hypothetical protein ACP5P2_03685, partial [Candidatus Micrarchaeia archaeon]